MIGWTEPCSSLQSTWDFFSKIYIQTAMAGLLKLKIPTKAKFRFSWSNLHLQFDFALSFVKFFDPWLETCHTIMIRAHTHPLTCYTSELEDSKAFPSSYKIKLQVLSWLSLQGYHQGYGLYKKRNKRCIPKEGMPHAQKACQKKVQMKEKRCIPKESMPHAVAAPSKLNRLKCTNHHLNT